MHNGVGLAVACEEPWANTVTPARQCVNVKSTEVNEPLTSAHDCPTDETTDPHLKRKRKDLGAGLTSLEAEQRRIRCLSAIQSATSRLRRR